MELEERYSGKFTVRVPPYLHERLVRAAEDQGVSLNTLIQTSMAEAVERLAANRRARRAKQRAGDA